MNENSSGVCVNVFDFTGIPCKERTLPVFRVTKSNPNVGTRHHLAWFQDDRFLPDHQAEYLKRLKRLRDSLDANERSNTTLSLSIGKVPQHKGENEFGGLSGQQAQNDIVERPLLQPATNGSNSYRHSKLLKTPRKPYEINTEITSLDASPQKTQVTELLRKSRDNGKAPMQTDSPNVTTQSLPTVVTQKIVELKKPVVLTQDSSRLDTLHNVSISSDTPELFELPKLSLATVAPSGATPPKVLTVEEMNKLIDAQKSTLAKLKLASPKDSAYVRDQKKLIKRRKIERMAGEKNGDGKESIVFIGDKSAPVAAHQRDHRGLYRGAHRTVDKKQDVVSDGSESLNDLKEDVKHGNKRLPINGYGRYKVRRNVVKRQGTQILMCPPSSPNASGARKRNGRGPRLNFHHVSHDHVTMNGHHPGQHANASEYLPRDYDNCILCRHPELIPFSLEPSAFFELPDFDQPDDLQNDVPPPPPPSEGAGRALPGQNAVPVELPVNSFGSLLSTSGSGGHSLRVSDGHSAPDVRTIASPPPRQASPPPRKTTDDGAMEGGGSVGPKRIVVDMPSTLPAIVIDTDGVDCN